MYTNPAPYPRWERQGRVSRFYLGPGLPLYEVATLDLLAALPGHPFSEVEREVRLAMDRYVATRVRLQAFGWLGRLSRASQWLEVHSQLGQDLLNLRSVLDLSPAHREAFRSVVAGLPAGSPYRKVFAQLDA